MKTKVIICGAHGRMGQAIIAAAKLDKKIDVLLEVDKGDDITRKISQTDVVIDFTNASATLDIAQAAAKHRKALVIGTTGHTPQQRKKILQTLKHIPVVWASNFSIGVNVLFHIVTQVSSLLGEDFDVGISETHHKTKRDTPSGTAKTLQEAVHSGRVRDVQISALRLGDVHGEHSVVFAGTGERLELTHRATGRELFARGALHAAQWIKSQKPGLYDMQDVLGLR